MARPISPHLAWYKRQITTVLSIFHRITGLTLAAGSIGLAWWIIAVSADGSIYVATAAVYSSIIVLLTIVGWCVNHLLGVPMPIWGRGDPEQKTAALMSEVFRDGLTPHRLLCL